LHLKKEDPVSQHARIIGNVEYREGDGQAIVIPPGPCDVEITEQDVTLSWTEGDTHGSAAMPLSEFERYVAEKAIEVLD
jgi:hypothetical protein